MDPGRGGLRDRHAVVRVGMRRCGNVLRAENAPFAEYRGSAEPVELAAVGAGGSQVIHGADTLGVMDNTESGPRPSLKIPKVVLPSPRAKSRFIRGMLVSIPSTRWSSTGVAVVWKALRMSSTEALGAACFMTAQAPATCGVACEVP